MKNAPHNDAISIFKGLVENHEGRHGKAPRSAIKFMADTSRPGCLRQNLHCTVQSCKGGVRDICTKFSFGECPDVEQVALRLRRTDNAHGQNGGPLAGALSRFAQQGGQRLKRLYSSGRNAGLCFPETGRDLLGVALDKRIGGCLTETAQT